MLVNGGSMKTGPNISTMTAGTCRSRARFASRRHSWAAVDFPARFGILKFKNEVILFDTGYAPRVKNALRQFPFWLYGAILPVTVDENNTAHAKIKKLGIRAEDVTRIVVSHFHADHIGGLKDFPTASFICSRRSWQHVKNAGGFQALRRGYLSELVPDDFEERVQFTEELEDVIELPGLGKAPALNIEGTRISFPSLDGHVPGQIGMHLQGADGTAQLFVADACWHKDAIAGKATPNPIGMFVQDCGLTYHETLRRLYDFSQQCPETNVIVTHHWEKSHA